MNGPSLRRALRLLLFLAAAALALTVGLADRPQAVVAWQTTAPNTCMGNVCGTSSPCTANDVRIVEMLTWEVLDYCLSSAPGETATAIFRAKFVAGANTRYDPGVWVAQDGGNAKTGECYSAYFEPPLATKANYNPVFGPFWDAEDTPGSGDECGDIEQGVPTYELLGPITFPCRDANNDGIIDPIGTCTAWDNNVGANCPANNACPGTGSKCHCGLTTVEVTTWYVDLALIKTASRDPILPGEIFSYTIQITNNGPKYSTGFAITDNLDPWLHLISGTGPEATCQAEADPADPPGWGESVTCFVTQDLPVGDTYELVLTVQLHDSDPNPPWNGDPPAQIANTACVRGNEFDTSSDNDCDDETVTTPVTLAHFESRGQGDRVHFAWTTTTEAGNAGFNLYVQTTSGSGAGTFPAWLRLNDRLIPSRVIDSIDPQTYSFEAAGVRGDQFLIEEVSVRTRTQRYGPFTLGQVYGTPARVEAIDWPAIRAEHEAQAALQRQQTITELEATPRIRLLVDRDGLYRVTYEDLLAAGFDLNGTRSANLALTNQGAPVPILVAGGPRFGPGGFLEFRAQAFDSLYTHTNVYLLQIDRNLAQRVAIDTTRPSGGVPPVPYYLETVTVDRNQAYSFLAPNGDPWYDTSMLAYTQPQSWSFDLEVDALQAGAAPASLTVGAWGVSEWPVSPDHHLVVSLNGTSVADEWFDGLADHPVSIQLPDGLLLEGANSLQLTLPGDTGADWDIVNLDRYQVTYSRAFVARDGRLSFHAAGALFRVENLPTANVVVYRIDDAGSARLARVFVNGSDGAYRAWFAGSEAPATYLVSTVGSLLSPGIEAGRPDADITTGTAGYLVIAHPSFLDGLDPLLAVRESQGWDVRVVNVEDIYAQFGYDIFGAEPIRDYIAYAAANMGTEYVLLAGGDTYDYLDYLGSGSMSFVPSLYAATDSYASFAPVDPLYADVDGDGIPDLAIGRFPVRTTAELDLMVAKTLAYENKTYGQTAVFAADGGFGADSDSFIALLPDAWAVQEAHIDAGGVGAARATLIDALNSGVALASYVGHSGTTVWTFDGLLGASDAAALTNHGAPAVVTQWGCWNTYYVAPSYSTMAHKFLLSGDQGAAAVLGSTTISYDYSERALALLLTADLVEPGLPLGAALTGAKAALATNHPGLADVLLGWTILGDPALVIEP